MISHKVITRISAFFAMISWLAMTFTDISVIFSYENDMEPDINPQIPVIAFNSFLLFLFIFYKVKIEKTENVNFIDLLWRVFVTGLITTAVSLFFRTINLMIGESALSQYVIFREFVYLVNLGLLSAILISCFAVFRRLILYQKSKFLITVWKIFQYSLLISLIYNVLPFSFLSWIYNYYLIFLVLLGLFLSANMKWVAYLNFKQKWKGILLVALALFYLVYFIWWVIEHWRQFSGTPFLDFMDNVFFVALIAFVLIYTIFSLLVLLFNLPTSSVFEQKLEEVGNFQKLSQSIQTEQTEESIYNILLESSVSTVFAEAAWLELELNDNHTYFTFKMDEIEVAAIKEKLTTNRVK
ncbi:MAG: serine/threonine protein phosphatase, partial [Cyclobacteriaceae bacterium]|nr:serine/threonine protein phosphatase [Cyclobacteriaceae bacterium]